MKQARIPEERLFHIAARKLAALGIATSLTTEGGSMRLAGRFTLPGGRFASPFDGQPVKSFSFHVVGHDHWQFETPPFLGALGPLPFFDFSSADEALDFAFRKLEQRIAALRLAAERMRGLGMEARINPQTLNFVSLVELAAVGKLELEGDGHRLLIKRLQRVGSGQMEELEPIEVPVDEIGDRIDMELILGRLVEQARPLALKKSFLSNDSGQASGSAADASASHRAVSIGELAERLGPEPLLAEGLIVYEDMVVGGRAVRFAARLEKHGHWSVRVVEGDRLVHSGQVPFDSMTPPRDFVAGVLNSPDVSPAVRSPAPADAQKAPITDSNEVLELHRSLPVAGEVWVMTVLVEREEKDEIRYVNVDSDGQPYGASRILPRNVFEQVFVPVTQGVFRLPVEVVSVGGNKVNYYQLDANRRRSGQMRSCEVTAFLSSFVPEAAAY